MQHLRLLQIFPQFLLTLPTCSNRRDFEYTRLVMIVLDVGDVVFEDQRSTNKHQLILTSVAE